MRSLNWNVDELNGASNPSGLTMEKIVVTIIQTRGTGCWGPVAMISLPVEIMLNLVYCLYDKSPRNASNTQNNPISGQCQCRGSFPFRLGAGQCSVCHVPRSCPVTFERTYHCGTLWRWSDHHWGGPGQSSTCARASCASGGLCGTTQGEFSIEETGWGEGWRNWRRNAPDYSPKLESWLWSSWQDPQAVGHVFCNKHLMDLFQPEPDQEQRPRGMQTWYDLILIKWSSLTKLGDPKHL